MTGSLVVVGTGVAGLTAAVEAARLGVRVVALESDDVTHQPRQAGDVDVGGTVVDELVEPIDDESGVARFLATRGGADDPAVRERSLFVDASGISPVDFGITDEAQEMLLEAGREAAVGFLQDWDFDDYLAHRRGAEGAT